MLPQVFEQNLSANCGFILSEANGQRSRENGTIPGGTGVLKAGTVLMAGGGGLIAFTGEESTAGGSNEAAGILLYNVDASGEDDVDVSYIARDAEVNLKALVYPEANTAHPGAEIKANVVASLKLLNIICRD